MFISVLLPEPEGPMTATNSPGWMATSTPSSAATAAVANTVHLAQSARQSALSPTSAVISRIVPAEGAWTMDASKLRWDSAALASAF